MLHQNKACPGYKPRNMNLFFNPAIHCQKLWQGRQYIKIAHASRISIDNNYVYCIILNSEGIVTLQVQRRRKNGVDSGNP
jgi:hypothetical protein